MLGKLLKYDFSALSKPLGILQIIAIGVTIVAAMCGFAGYWLNELGPAYLEILTALALMGVGFGILGLVCLVPAAFVIVLYRFYSNFFTDQGYLTFTLPVKQSELLWSKVISGVAWLLISAFVASVGALIVSSASLGFAYGLEFDDSIPYWVLSASSNWYTEDSGNIFNLVCGAIGSILTLIAALMTAYMGFTLGASWSSKHKVACGIALFIGIYWGVGLLFSIVDVAITIGFYDLPFSSRIYDVIGWLLYAIHILRDIVLCVVGFCVTLLCLNKRVNLS